MDAEQHITNDRTTYYYIPMGVLVDVATIPEMENLTCDIILTEGVLKIVSCTEILTPSQDT